MGKDNSDNFKCTESTMVQNISAVKVINPEDGSETYKINNPNKIGYMFLGKNEPFCLAYGKETGDKKKESFLFSSQKESVIQKTENESYILNQSTIENITENINNVISKTVNNICNSSVVSSIQYNELDFSGVSFCSELGSSGMCKNIVFDVEQGNDAYISLDSKFTNDLATQLSTDIKNEICNQITNNISETVLDDLMSELDYTKNEDIFSKLLGIYTVGSKKSTEIENSIKNVFNSQTNSTSKMTNIIENTVNNSSINDVVNNAVASAQQYNKGKVNDTKYQAENIQFVWTQKNTSELLLKSIVNNNISTEILNNLLGDTSGFSQNETTIDKTTKTSSASKTDISDSLFGSTSTWQILIVAVVIIVIAIVVLKVMSGGATGGVGTSGTSGMIVKLVIGLIILIIVVVVIVLIVKAIKKSKNKDSESSESFSNNSKGSPKMIKSKAVKNNVTKNKKNKKNDNEFLYTVAEF